MGEEKETIQNFLEGLNEKIVLLEGAVRCCSKLLAVGPAIVQGEDRQPRSGMIGSILDSLEGTTQKVHDLLGEVGAILDELERL